MKPTLVFRFLLIALVASFLSAAAAETPCLIFKEDALLPVIEPCGGDELRGSYGTCDPVDCCGGFPEAPCEKVTV